MQGNLTPQKPNNKVLKDADKSNKNWLIFWLIVIVAVGLACLSNFLDGKSIMPKKFNENGRAIWNAGVSAEEK